MRRAALAAAVALGVACGPGDGGWVARVDGEGIALETLREAVEARVGSSGDARRDDVLNEELSRLVSERVEMHRVRELGVEISDEEVRARLSALHGPDFSTQDAEYLEEVRAEMARERAALLDLADKVGVPEDAIADYFEEHKEELARPARIQIRQIVVEDRERADALMAELAAGADFASLAERHSQGPEKSEGGLLPPFAAGEMPEVFDRAFDLDLNQTSDVVESPYGFHIFQLVARFPARPAELEEARDTIVEELQARRLAELRRGWLRELRRRAEVEVDERLLDTLR